MDLKSNDLKLFLSLFENSKKSNRQIAKEIGISKETVASRINYFLKNDYIKDFALNLDYSLLAYKEFNIFIRLNDTRDEFMEEFISYLVNLANSTWVGKSFGFYDIKLAIILKDINDVNSIIHDISSKYSSSINKIDFLYIIDKFKASPELFLKNLFNNGEIFSKNKSILNSKLKNKTKVFLDDIDRQILYQLGNNPKKTYVDIALELDLSAEAVMQRVKKLEKKGIIKGNSVVFNGIKFDKIWCQILLNVDAGSVNEFKKYLKTKVFLSNYVETMGVRNFSVTFFASNIDELYKNLNELRNEFSKSIRNFDFMIFFDLYKYPKVPRCVLEE